MQDEKGVPEGEQPPEKPDYTKFFKESGANARDRFNELMLAYASRDPQLNDKLAALSNERGNIFSIGIGVLKNPAVNSVAVSPHLIAQALVVSAFMAGWQDMAQKIIWEVYDKRKGYPVALVSAFMIAIAKGHYDSLKAAIEDSFLEGKKEEAAALLSEVGEKRLVSEFRSELVKMIVDEDLGKMNALSALSAIVTEDIVAKETMVSMLDDWDDDCRFFAANVLAKVKDGDAALKALDLAEDEPNADIKFHLYRIMENNLEAVVPAIMQKLLECENRREAADLVSVLMKIEKPESVKALANEIKESLKPDARAAVEKILK